MLRTASPNGNDMLLNGKAPLPGQVMKFPKLANTFRELVIHGKDGFYKGRIAKAIVDLIKSRGGMMELDDLAKHQTAIVKPIKYTYAKDVTVYEVISIQDWSTSPTGSLPPSVSSEWTRNHCIAGFGHHREHPRTGVLTTPWGDES